MITEKKLENAKTLFFTEIKQGNPEFTIGSLSTPEFDSIEKAIQRVLEYAIKSEVDESVKEPTDDMISQVQYVSGCQEALEIMRDLPEVNGDGFAHILITAKPISTNDGAEIGICVAGCTKSLGKAIASILDKNPSVLSQVCLNLVNEL